MEAEIAARRYLGTMIEGEVIRFSNSEMLEFSLADSQREILDIRWLSTLKKGEVFSLNFAYNRLSKSAVEIVKSREVARLSVGFRTIEELQSFQRISPRLEEICLYEVPQGYFESRTDYPPHRWSSEEKREIAALVERIVRPATLRSVRLTIAGLWDDVAMAIARRENREKLEVVDLRGQQSEISDEGLRALATLPRAREVVVKVGPKVTKDGIAAFGSGRFLERLEFRDLPAGLDDAITTLKSKLPKTDIVLATSHRLER